MKASKPFFIQEQQHQQQKTKKNIEIDDDDDVDGDNHNGNDEKEAQIYWPNIVLARSMWLELYSVHPSLILSISRTYYQVVSVVSISRSVKRVHFHFPPLRSYHGR